MGSGSSSHLSAGLAAASEEELQRILAGLDANSRSKLHLALAEASSVQDRYKDRRGSPKPICAVFAVDDVQPGYEGKKASSDDDDDDAECWHKISITHTAAKLLEILVQSPVLHSSTDRVLCRTGDMGATHPLLSSVHLAFARHYNIAFSPEVIWLTITQGVALHIKNNAEALRSKFFAEEATIGKRMLAVTTHSSAKTQPPGSFWSEIVGSLTKGLGEALNSDIVKCMRVDFSSTTEEEKVAGNIVILDGLQAYFDYVTYCICGIPNVVLEGSIGDWKRLREKIDSLESMDLGLDFWIPHVKCIVDHFVRSSQKDVDVEFWQRIYKVKSEYGRHTMNGWIGCLFPYVKTSDGVFQTRNPMLQQPWEKIGVGAKFVQDDDEEDDEQEENEEEDEKVTKPSDGAEKDDKLERLALSEFPSGLSSAPVTVVEIDETRTYQVVGGLLGVDMHSEAMADFPAGAVLRAQIGWSVHKLRGVHAVIDRLRTSSGCHQIFEGARGNFLDRVRCLPGGLIELLSTFTHIDLWATGACRNLLHSGLDGLSEDEIATLVENDPDVLLKQAAVETEEIDGEDEDEDSEPEETASKANDSELTWVARAGGQKHVIHAVHFYRQPDLAIACLRMSREDGDDAEISVFGEIFDGSSREYLLCRPDFARPSDKLDEESREQEGDEDEKGTSPNELEGVRSGFGGIEDNRFSYCLAKQKPCEKLGWRGARPLKGQTPPWRGGEWAELVEVPRDVEVEKVRHLTHDLCALLTAVLDAKDAVSAVSALRRLPEG